MLLTTGKKKEIMANRKTEYNVKTLLASLQSPVLHRLNLQEAAYLFGVERPKTKTDTKLVSLINGLMETAEINQARLKNKTDELTHDVIPSVTPLTYPFYHILSLTADSTFIVDLQGLQEHWSTRKSPIGTNPYKGISQKQLDNELPIIYRRLCALTLVLYVLKNDNGRTQKVEDIYAKLDSVKTAADYKSVMKQIEDLNAPSVSKIVPYTADDFEAELPTKPQPSRSQNFNVPNETSIRSEVKESRILLQSALGLLFGGGLFLAAFSGQGQKNNVLEQEAVTEITTWIAQDAPVSVPTIGAFDAVAKLSDDPQYRVSNLQVPNKDYLLKVAELQDYITGTDRTSSDSLDPNIYKLAFFAIIMFIVLRIALRPLPQSRR